MTFRHQLSDDWKFMFEGTFNYFEQCLGVCWQFSAEFGIFTILPVVLNQARCLYAPTYWDPLEMCPWIDVPERGGRFWKTEENYCHWTDKTPVPLFRHCLFDAKRGNTRLLQLHALTKSFPLGDDRQKPAHTIMWSGIQLRDHEPSLGQNTR